MVIGVVVVVWGGVWIFMRRMVKNVRELRVVGGMGKLVMGVIGFVVRWVMLRGVYVLMGNRKVKVKDGVIWGIVGGRGEEGLELVYMRRELWVWG